MMASMAEQRRFLMHIHQVNTARLEMIASDLMELVKDGNATESDVKFHEQVCLELFSRIQKEGAR